LRHNEPDLANPWLDEMRVEYDEAKRWIVMHRGSLAITCNLGTEAVDVPVIGDVVLAWGEPTVGADTTRLDAQSVAILRTVKP
jgi:maltooligosyltrehalose trehalohydrolase